MAKIKTLVSERTITYKGHKITQRISRNVEALDGKTYEYGLITQADGHQVGNICLNTVTGLANHKKSQMKDAKLFVKVALCR